MISGGAPSSLVVPSPQPQRSEDTPDPDFMTKFRAFLMEEFSVELDLTLGCAFPATLHFPYGEGPGCPSGAYGSPTLYKDRTGGVLQGRRRQWADRS